MLLFFALALPSILTTHANAQSAKKGWSVDSGTANAEQATEPPSVPDEAVLESDVEGAIDAAEDSEDDLALDETTEPSGSEPSPGETGNPFAIEEGADSEPETPTTPVLDLDPQLRDNLERQFKRIVEIQESEDAFSESLGEAYLSYGQALQKAGRLEEARKMFANALHITKINNGVNSMEQRSVLRAMFEMSYAQGNAEDSEESLKRIIWLEKKFPDNRDDFSFDMVVRLGNLYIDRYLYRPTVSESALLHLNQAERYLKYAVDRYGGRPMDELFMPYGELALVHFFKSKIQVDVTRPNYEYQRQQTLSALEQNVKTGRSTENSLGRAERYLNEYLRKARAEERTEDMVQALTNLGDINLLFEREVRASQYYEFAWTEAQNLPPDHPIVLMFEQPKVLPAFNYSRERAFVEGYRETIFVPTTFSLTDAGRVKKFAEADDTAVSPDLAKRARRAAKRLRFRPAIENGKMIAISEFTHDVKVKVRRQQANN